MKLSWVFATQYLLDEKELLKNPLFVKLQFCSAHGQSLRPHCQGLASCYHRNFQKKLPDYNKHLNEAKNLKVQSCGLQ